MDDDAAEAVAKRLRLPPHRDRYNEPWRYYLLLYLADLVALADYEHTHFGREEARVALELLLRDIEDVLLLLRGGPPRAPRHRRRGGVR